MKDLRGKVAVITGGASGIGRALAERAAAQGMKLVLADVEIGALDKAADELRAGGADVLAVPTDVADAEQMDMLGARTLERFGAAHLICNNAGVAGGGPMWELSTADWEFVLRVNLWGVIHGVRVFGPGLVAQDEGHFVNTASMAGLVSVPGLGPYNVTKHAVVTLSETLYGELQGAGSGVGVSVLCPGFVKTRIYESDRNRPEHLGPSQQIDAAEREQRRKMAAAFFEQAMSPREVADLVLDAVVRGRFYILTHDGAEKGVEQRMSAILSGGVPPVPAPDIFGQGD